MLTLHMHITHHKHTPPILSYSLHVYSEYVCSSHTYSSPACSSHYQNLYSSYSIAGEDARLSILRAAWIISGGEFVCCELLSLCSWFNSWGADELTVGSAVPHDQLRTASARRSTPPSNASSHNFKFNMKNTSMYLKYIAPTFLFKYQGNIKGKLLYHKTITTGQITHFGFWNLEKAKKQRVKAPNLIS